jgi:hypothetical protein
MIAKRSAAERAKGSERANLASGSRCRANVRDMEIEAGG